MHHTMIDNNTNTHEIPLPIYFRSQEKREKKEGKRNRSPKRRSEEERHTNQHGDGGGGKNLLRGVRYSTSLLALLFFTFLYSLRLVRGLSSFLQQCYYYYYYYLVWLGVRLVLVVQPTLLLLLSSLSSFHTNKMVGMKGIANNKSNKVLLLLISVIMMMEVTQGASYTWTSGGAGPFNFNDAANWFSPDPDVCFFSFISSFISFFYFSFFFTFLFFLFLYNNTNLLG